MRPEAGRRSWAWTRLVCSTAVCVLGLSLLLLAEALWTPVIWYAVRHGQLLGGSVAGLIAVFPVALATLDGWRARTWGWRLVVRRVAAAAIPSCVPVVFLGLLANAGI